MPNSFKGQVNEQAKDINIISMFIFLLKYKWLILFFVLLAGVATPSYLFVLGLKTPDGVSSQKGYYFSQCSISPHDGMEKESSSSRTEKLKLLLQSRNLTQMVIKENKLPMISQNIWDEKTIGWVTECLYVWDERSGALSTGQPGSTASPVGTATLYVKPQNNILTMGFASDEREKTIKILDRYLSYISDFYRQRDMAIIKAQQELYQKQLPNVKDTYLKARLLEKTIELNDKELRAKNDRYYGYEMMDSPTVIEVKPQKQITITKGSSTKRYFSMTFLLMMAAFVIALTIAGAMEYLSLAKKNDPEGFAVLLKHLRRKKRSSRTANPD